MLLSSLLQVLPIQFTSTVISQSLGCLLRRDVPLWLGHQFVANKELADCSATEERWIEVHVEMRGVDFLLRAFKGSLVDARACQNQPPFQLKMWEEWAGTYYTESSSQTNYRTSS